MKFFLIIATIGFLIGCASREDKKTTTQVQIDTMDSTVMEDTFRSLPIQRFAGHITYGTQMDTIILNDTATSASFEACYPRVSGKKFPEVHDWIKGYVDRQKHEFLTSRIKGNDSLLRTEVVSVVFSKGERLLSMVMSTVSSAWQTGYYWDHESFNYDLATGRKIELTDYFIMETLEDTLFLNRFLERTVGVSGQKIDIRMYEQPLSTYFSFCDRDGFVVFYFDRHDVFAGIGDMVKMTRKKYIIKHIKPEYR